MMMKFNKVEFRLNLDILFTDIRHKRIH